ncbi:MAG: PEP-CTERM sorting domain-containing protein [Caldimonas sp.]
MKKILTAVALATLAASAGAQVTFAGGTDQVITGIYNPTGTTTVQTGGKRNATLSSTTAGILTGTFLGFEALDTDTWTFSMGSGTLTNKTATADVSTIFGPVSAGLLTFTFADLFTGTSVGNGGVGVGGTGMFTSYMVFGTGTGAGFVPYTKGGLYDVVIGFNDGLQVDGDYDDLIVGLKVAAIPEPETYALLLAGLGAVGFIARRRQRQPQG